MAAKAVAFMLVMVVMVSAFMDRADAVDVEGSGRSLLRLQFFTNYAQERGLTTIEEATGPAPSAETPATKKGQTWVKWFTQSMSAVSSAISGSSNNGAAAPAPAA